ncbi:MAG: nitronate monooxygenase [Planctomycetota bacterium]|jgi:nitronate monooxygenase
MTPMKKIGLPKIIQGGMGAGVSSWSLAKAVSSAGQLGVVSGTALDVILARRLEVGDPGGHMRRALSHFPIPGVAQRILDRYFIDGGKPEDKRFKAKPMPSEKPSGPLLDLLVAGNFVEVFLAREGHDHPVGINYLEKIQVPNLPSIFGAMLAGVGFVLMGAGIPIAIPSVLDQLSAGQAVKLHVDVKGTTAGVFAEFDPVAYCGGVAPELVRPKFLAIISTDTIANVLIRRTKGGVDGFIVEGPTAGGHNAPPRGAMQLSEKGEPLYTKRDVPNLETIKGYGLPFWLAGSFAGPEKIQEALDLGATGVQVGTAFAYCEESGIDPDLKAQVLAMSAKGEVEIFTDPVASPTGFPFKVVQTPGTFSDNELYKKRSRICDLGYLRHAYAKDDGAVAWRCPAEPVEDYVRKGGDIADTVGRKCVCNGLMADIGLGQIQKSGARELAIMTSGDDVAHVARFLKDGKITYSAQEVLDSLLGSASTSA